MGRAEKPDLLLKQINMVFPSMYFLFIIQTTVLSTNTKCNNFHMRSYHK